MYAPGPDSIFEMILIIIPINSLLTLGTYFTLVTYRISMYLCTNSSKLRIEMMLYSLKKVVIVKIHDR